LAVEDERKKSKKKKRETETGLRGSIAKIATDPKRATLRFSDRFPEKFTRFRQKGRRREPSLVTYAISSNDTSGWKVKGLENSAIPRKFHGPAESRAPSIIRGRPLTVTELFTPIMIYFRDPWRKLLFNATSAAGRTSAGAALVP